VEADFAILLLFDDELFNEKIPGKDSDLF